MNLDNVLFIDTESNPLTKKPESLQYLIGDTKGIITDFSRENYYFIKELWDKSEAVIMFNAPYDLGVLSIMFEDNDFKWIESEEKGSMWDMILFDNRYFVRKLGFHRNLIKPRKRIELTRGGKLKRNRTGSTPVVDLLKLWSILVHDGRDYSISLKSLIKRELKEDAIEYTEENARTDSYRYQDVIKLKELTKVFFEKVKGIKDIQHYSWEDWGYIKTPATFTKLSYEEEYYNLYFTEEKEHRINNIMDDRINCFDGLEAALESAFNGGITTSFYRGKKHNTGWVDISGAYVHAIEYLNTDSYGLCRIEHYTEGDYKKSNCMAKVKTNFVIKSINNSLKLFAVEKPFKTWYWYNDIEACSMLYDDFSYEVLEFYEFVPELNINESLPVRWSREKDREKQENGKTTYYDFCKFRGNTAYGIRAQRKPFTTRFTNMIIAGMITSTVHMVLATINHTINNYHNHKVLGVNYNDTDSACFDHYPHFTEEDMKELIDTINDRIAPYTVESEGYGKTTHFLSLKRYISEGGTGKDKIKLHGKGRYNVNQTDIYNYVVKNQLPEKQLEVKQLAANTERSMKQILNLFPYLEEYKHPFMFVTDVPVTNRTMEDFFLDWYTHIDTKTTFKLRGEFNREFHKFSNYSEATDFFNNYKEEYNPDNINENYRKWDDEIDTDFYTLDTIEY